MGESDLRSSWGDDHVAFWGLLLPDIRETVPNMSISSHVSISIWNFTWQLSQCTIDEHFAMNIHKKLHCCSRQHIRIGLEFWNLCKHTLVQNSIRIQFYYSSHISHIHYCTYKNRINQVNSKILKMWSYLCMKVCTQLSLTAFRISRRYGLRKCGRLATSRLSVVRAQVRNSTSLKNISLVLTLKVLSYTI